MTIISSTLHLAIAASVLLSSADAASFRGYRQQRRHLQSTCDGGLNDGELCSTDADCSAKACSENPFESCSNNGDCSGGSNKCNAGTCPSSVTTTTTTTMATTTTTTTTTSSGPMTCPEEHCASQTVSTPATLDASTVCPSLAAVTLATYEYDGDVLIELTGPSNLSDAADLVITAPHGGALKPSYIPDRSTSGDYCPSSGCKTLADSYTLDIATKLQEKTIANYCKVPFLIKNHLHRSKLDANREIGEAAHGNAIAEAAFQQFHDLIAYAQTQVRAQFGDTDVTNSGGSTITGINGLVFDVHGYSGKDWVPDDGSPLIQWGYRLADDTSLNTDNYCPLDTRSSGTIGSMTHARWMDGQSYECLVRGPGSLGSRVASLIDANNLPTSIGDATMCGKGTPSYEFPSPYHIATDPAHCDRYANDEGECHYYSGGYDVEVHERTDWENKSGDHMNAVQAELPRCIRWAGSQVREDFADILSQAMMGFLRDLYG